jgi:hypothetical protein
MSNSKNKITVIIPVHELNDKTSGLFKKALESVKNQKVQPEKVMVVAKRDGSLIVSIEKIAEEAGVSIDIVPNSGKTDFASQMNLGIDKLETSHFCMLEFDDELSPIWIENAYKYMGYYPEVDMFLPIVVEMNHEGRLLGFTNEPVWANEFSDTMGELDFGTLARYSNFNFDGMVMSREKYMEFGGLKPSIKMAFPLEFLLRVTNFSGRVMVIPKFGYKHTNGREESLFETCKNELSMDERRWWLSTAKKEYLHTNDRDLKYEG